MISLDEEIQKDRERHRNGNQRGTHSKRGSRNFNGYDRHNTRRNDHMLDEAQETRYGNRSSGRSDYNPTKMVVKISNLHYSVTKEQLQAVCEQVGKVKNCRILWDKSGRSNERATVEYFERSDGEKAVDELRGKILEQQPIETELEEVSNRMPGKRHDIRRNFHSHRGGSNNNRFRHGRNE